MDQLLTFAAAVWEGQYGLRALVKVQSVKRALRHVTQRLVLDGHPDPRRSSPAQQSLDLPIARLIKKYLDEDPPVEPKLAIPISTITAITTKYWWNPRLEVVADLVIIAFFYLLRVGEYTTASNKKPKRTIALQDCNVRLWQPPFDGRQCNNLHCTHQEWNKRGGGAPRLRHWPYLPSSSPSTAHC
jgi:hypothetical protein